MISQRSLSYVVPKRMQTKEKAQAKRLLRREPRPVRDRAQTLPGQERVARDDADLPTEGGLLNMMITGSTGIHVEER